MPSELCATSTMLRLDIKSFICDFRVETDMEIFSFSAEHFLWKGQSGRCG